MKAKPFIITGVLLGLAYAGYLVINQVNLLKKTCIKMASYQLTGLFTQNAQLKLVLKITNKSDLDLMLKNGKFDIALNGLYVATVSLNVSKLLARHSTIELPLIANFNPKQALKSALQAVVSNANNLQIGVTGKITVLSNYISFNSLKINETISVSELLKPSTTQQAC